MKHREAQLVGMIFLFGGILLNTDAFSSSPRTPPPEVQACLACHGPDATAKQPTYPRLAGQHADYIVAQIRDFQSGRRKDPVMSPLAASLDEKTVRLIARFFESQPVTPAPKQDAECIRQGRKHYLEHLCFLCHHAREDNANPALPVGPVIAGQNRAYLVKAMKDIKLYKRPADVYELMHRNLDGLSDADIDALACYISTSSAEELLR